MRFAIKGVQALHMQQRVQPWGGSRRPRPEIGLFHRRIARNRRVIALRQHAAPVQDSDRVAKAGHHAKICSTISTVRPFAARRIRSATRSMSSWPMPAIGSSSSIIRGRARAWRRFPAPVYGHRPFRRPWFRPIRRGRPRRAGRGRANHIGAGRLARTPEIERIAARALERDPHVLEGGEIGKNRRNLEGADQAAPRHVGRPGARYVATLIADYAARGLQEFGQEVETGGFSGAVRPDQGVNRMAPDAQAHFAHGGKACEFLGQPVRLEGAVAQKNSLSQGSGRLPGQILGASLGGGPASKIKAVGAGAMGPRDAARSPKYGEFAANLRALAFADAANGRVVATLSYGPIAQFHFSVLWSGQGLHLTWVNESFDWAGKGPSDGDPVCVTRRNDLIGAKTWRKQVRFPQRRRPAANQ